LSKKKVFILGTKGMIGHMLYRYLSSLDKYFLGGISHEELDITREPYKVLDIIKQLNPDILINAIGILPKECEENIPKAVFVNGFFPNLLEITFEKSNTKIIQLSTDCVFDGVKGNYIETDTPSEKNWYGRTKALGEILNSKDLTIRTSTIGPELKENGVGLFNWALNQKGKIKGYSKVNWTGVTTLELAKQLDKILSTKLVGIYHLVPNISITKKELLENIADIWNLNLEIEEDISVCKSKNLINTRQKEYAPNIPDYRSQLEELKKYI